MEKFEYKTSGICASNIEFEFDGDIIANLKVLGGCAGNRQGIAVLCIGRPIQEIIDKFKGIPCGNRGTSCPDQIAKGLIKYQEQVKI